MEEAAADSDLTYLRSRLVFRYDYRSLVEDVTMNRARLTSAFAFGPHQRLGVQLTIPVVHKDAAGDSAGGLADVEVLFGGNFYYRERFRAGANVEFVLPTATDPLLGGGTTTIEPAVGFAAVLTPRLELTGSFSYKKSIHTTRGTPFNEFEPDLALNARRWGVTWRAEWDSFYLFNSDQFAQKFKVVVSRALGREHRWVVSPYYAFPLNEAGRQTQYIRQVGMDVTWFFAGSKR